MLYALGCLAIIAFIAYRYCVIKNKKIWNNIIGKMPFLGSIIWQHQMSQALQALSLLVNSGMTLVTALAIVSKSVEDSVVKSQLLFLHDEVVTGQLLSSAMMISSYFLPEIVALIHIGEETGTLGQSLESAAAVYSDSLEGQLKRFIFFLQPAVIILLGLLVTTLIFAVYLPIMQLSYVI